MGGLVPFSSFGCLEVFLFLTFLEAYTMLRSAVTTVLRTGIRSRSVQPTRVAGVRLMSSKVEETDAEFDARFEAYFNRPEIDGWELRKGMHDLTGLDMVPEPKIVAAALRACRRVNDYALTTRFLEVVKYKCGPKEKEIWPYMVQELRPTLDELGILTPEEMGYDQPELMLPNPYEM